MKQDLEFVFRLLADVSIRCLSPAIDDPTSSVQALDQIDLLLREVGGIDLDTGVVRDARGAVRFVRRVPSWEEFVSLALLETRQFGAASAQVIRRMRALLVDLREAVAEYRRGVLDRELVLLDSMAARSFPLEGDRSVVSVADRQGLGSG